MDLENAIREIKELKLSNEGYKEAMEKIASITATLSTTPEVTILLNTSFIGSTQADPKAPGRRLLVCQPITHVVPEKDPRCH